MRRVLWVLFPLVLFVAAAQPAFAAEKKYLLIALTLQPVAALTMFEAGSQADCWAKGKAFLDWADKAQIAAGFACEEIVPGSKPPGLKLDKDGKPIQFRKERDS